MECHVVHTHFQLWIFADDVTFLAELELATWTSRTYTWDDGIRGRISRARAELAEDKSLSFGQQGGWAINNHSSSAGGVEKFVYLISLVHSTTQSSADISRHNAITRAAMQNLDNQIWKLRSSISTKLKQYNTGILPTSCAALSAGQLPREMDTILMFLSVRMLLLL